MSKVSFPGGNRVKGMPPGHPLVKILLALLRLGKKKLKYFNTRLDNHHLSLCDRKKPCISMLNLKTVETSIKRTKQSLNSLVVPSCLSMASNTEDENNLRVLSALQVTFLKNLAIMKKSMGLTCF